MICVYKESMGCCGVWNPFRLLNAANYIRKPILKFSLPYVQNARHNSKKSSSSPEYCMDMVRKHDYENFLCTLLLPSAIRRPAFALRAFNIEVANVSVRAKEQHASQMRIMFWEETLENIILGKPPKHPVALELARAFNHHKLLKRNLVRLINARKNHLSGTMFQSLREMENYAEDTVSCIYFLLLQVAGIKNINADHAGSHLGKAQGISILLRSVPHNASHQTYLLPQDILLKHGVSQESILRGKTAVFKDAVYDIASEAKLHLDKARSLRTSVPKEARVIFLPAVAVDAFLENLRQVDFDIFNSKLQLRSSFLGWKLFWSKLRKKY